MSLPKSTSRQSFFSLSLSNSLSDMMEYPRRRSSILPPVARQKNRLDEAWLRAEKQFNEDTKKSLGSYDIKSKDGVLRQLKQRYDADDKAGKEKGARTETLEKILNSVEIVGAFAAQGVSIVFGPANLCFNAITFLLNAPRAISKVYDEIQELFLELEQFLAKFKIYRRIEDAVGLANEMCEDTNLLLICFVKVCGIAIKILEGSRWDAVKHGAAVALLKDDQVASALEEFRGLCNSSSSLANTVMLEHVLSSEVDVKKILKSARRLETGMGLLIARSNDEKTRIVNKDHLYRIQRNLFFQPPSQDFLVPSIQENGPETLAVLQSLEEFQEWMRSETARSMLTLWGPVGSGKSYMLDTIRDNLNLQRECASRRESSTYVAVHNFQDAESRTSQQTNMHIADVLKKMAFQVAVQSTTYAKELATLLSTIPHLRSEKDLNKVWKSLKLTEVRALSGATMYVLLDSVRKKHLQGDLRKLLDLFMDVKSQSRGLKIRVALATDNKPDSTRTTTFLSIPVNHINRKLVAAFVAEEMVRKDILQDVDRDTIALRQEVTKKLMSEPPRTTFTSAQRTLKRLKDAINADSPYSELAVILNDDSNPLWPDSGAETLKERQSQLSARSVTLLNEILSLLLYAPDGCMSLEVVEAALRLGVCELPIESLAKKIRHQYRKIIDVHHNSVLIHPSVMIALREAGKDGSDVNACEHKEPSIRMSIEINDATERTIKKFVWDLNQQILTGNFDFSIASMAARTYKISVDSLEAQLKIVRLCFKIFSEGWDERTRPMLDYACINLPYHLSSLQEIASKVNDTNIRMIGEGLITYITDPYHVKLRHESYGLGQWMYDERATDAVRFWLEASQPYMPLREQRWIQRTTDRARGKLGFLHDLAITLGEYWLTDARSKCFSLFCWLDTYLEQNGMISPSPSGKDCIKSRNTRLEAPKFLADLFRNYTRSLGKSESDNSIKTRVMINSGSESNIKRSRTVEDLAVAYKIQRAATWVMSNSRIVPNDTLFLALGNTCLAVEEWPVGLECYKRIFPEYCHRHFALLGGAFCKIGLKDISSGLAMGREAFAIFRKFADQGKLSDDDFRYYLDSLKLMGQQLEKLHRLSDALSFYDEAFVRKPRDPMLCWKVLKLHCQTDDIQAGAYTTLVDWIGDPEQHGYLCPAASLLGMVVGSDFELVILPLCRAMRNLYLQNLFLQVIEEAIRLADSSSDTIVLVKLRYLQGIVYSLSSETGASISAISTWKEVFTFPSDEVIDIWGITDLMKAAADNALRSEFDNLRSRILSDISLSVEEKHQLYLDFSGTLSDTMNTCSALLNHHGIDSGQNFVVSLCSMINIEEARRIYTRDMAQALEILTDNDEDNDAAGIYILTRIFCALGDTVSALSAFSLYDRAITRRRFLSDTPEPEWTVRDKVARGSVRTCTLCTKTMYSSDLDGMWWCRFCPLFELCGGCKVKYQNGSVRHERCSQRHVSSYVHLVHSGYTPLDLVGTRVRIDWDYEDDEQGGFTREGGGFIEVRDWVEQLRVMWDLPKPEGESSRAQQ